MKGFTIPLDFAVMFLTCGPDFIHGQALFFMDIFHPPAPETVYFHLGQNGTLLAMWLGGMPGIWP
jgi:hypothetical protein